MKKSALLAVSALSLGLVGLSTFVPVANATDSASGDAKVNVVVSEAFGIGTAEVKSASAWDAATADVDFGTIGVNAIAKDVAKTIYTLNNSGSPATLTLADNDTVTALVDGTNKNQIESGTGVAEGTSAWGVKLLSKSDYSKMPPATGEAALTVGKNNSGDESSKSFMVTYGVSTSATQAAGTYTDTVTYSFTK